MGTGKDNKNIYCFQFSIKNKFDHYFLFILVICSPFPLSGFSYIGISFTVCSSPFIAT